MNETKKTTIQLLKYGIIGISNTLITLIVFYLINTICGISENIANVLGYILGLINSFIWNRNWVFKTKNDWKKKRSYLLVGLSFAFPCNSHSSTICCTARQYQLLRYRGLPMKNTGENIAMCLGMIVYTLANYCFNRFITFKQNKSGQ